MGSTLSGPFSAEPPHAAEWGSLFWERPCVSTARYKRPLGSVQGWGTVSDQQARGGPGGGAGPQVFAALSPLPPHGVAQEDGRCVRPVCWEQLGEMGKALSRLGTGLDRAFLLLETARA